MYDSVRRTLLRQCHSKKRRAEVEDGEKWHPKETGDRSKNWHTDQPVHWGEGIPWTRPLTPMPVPEAEPTGLMAEILPRLGPGPGNFERKLCSSQETKPVLFSATFNYILGTNKAYLLSRTERECPRPSLIAASLFCNSHLHPGWRNRFLCKFSASPEKGKSSPKRSYFCFFASRAFQLRP